MPRKSTIVLCKFTFRASKKCPRRPVRPPNSVITGVFALYTNKFHSVIFLALGATFTPPGLMFSDFWHPFCIAMGPRTAKNSLAPPRTAQNLPRTCQEPAGQRLHPHPFLSYTGSVAPTRSHIARGQNQGAAVPRPLAGFNEYKPIDLDYNCSNNIVR